MKIPAGTSIPQGPWRCRRANRSWRGTELHSPPTAALRKTADSRSLARAVRISGDDPARIARAGKDRRIYRQTREIAGIVHAPGIEWITIGVLQNVGSALLR